MSFCRRAGHSTDAEPLGDRRIVDLEPRRAQPLDAGDRRRGIVDLVRADQRRRRHVERQVVALVVEAFRRPARPATRGPGGTAERRACPLRAAITPALDLALAADHRGHGALQDAGLLGRDPFELVAEKAGVVVADRRDGREHGLDDVGGVEAPAHADLDQRQVGRHAREREIRRRRRDLEEGDRLFLVGLLALGQDLVELGRPRSVGRRPGCAR